MTRLSTICRQFIWDGWIFVGFIQIIFYNGNKKTMETLEGIAALKKLAWKAVNIVTKYPHECIILHPRSKRVVDWDTMTKMNSTTKMWLVTNNDSLEDAIDKMHYVNDYLNNAIAMDYSGKHNLKMWKLFHP